MNSAKNERDRARLRKLAPVVLPRALAREAAQDARLRKLAAIPKATRTQQETQELSDLMAIWVMRQSGAVGDARSTYRR